MSLSISTIINATLSFLIAIVVLLAALIANHMQNEYQQAQMLQESNRLIDISRQVNNAFAKELTQGVILIEEEYNANNPIFDKFLHTSEKNHKNLDKMLDTIQEGTNTHIDENSKQVQNYIIKKVKKAQKSLEETRNAIISTAPPSAKIWYERTNNLFKSLSLLRRTLISPMNEKQRAFYENLVIKDAAAELFDAIATEGSILTYLLSSGLYMDESIKTDLVNARLRSEASLNILENFFNDNEDEPLSQAIIRSIDNMKQEFRIIENERRTIYSVAVFQSTYTTNVDEWVNNFHHLLDSILEVEHMVSEPTEKNIITLEKESAQNMLIAVIVGAFSTISILLLTIFVYFRVIKPIKTITNRMMYIAKGEKNIALPKKYYNDEIGKMIKTLVIFQENAQNLDNLKKERAAILAELSEAVIVTDKSGYMTDWTPASEKMLGFKREQVIGKHVHDVLYSQMQNLPPVQDVIQKAELGEISYHEPILILPDGEERYLEATIIPIFDEQNHLHSIVASLRDITERKNSEKMLQIAKNDADKANKAKTDFLANMSHEIRTPMNGIIGMNQLLLDTNLDEHQTEFANSIRFNAESLMALINDLLDLSKIEAEKIELDYQSCNLRRVISDAIDLLAPKALEKDLDLILDYAPSIPQYVMADAFYLRQIMNNLISNAVKFTQKGHVIIKVTNTATEDTHIDQFNISVIDTGIGVKEEKMAKIFDKFSQADSSSTRKYGGTGLGLAISKKLVEIMHGEISISSVFGKGSTFHFNLPLEKDLTITHDHEDLSEGFFNGLNILVADSNSIRRNVTCESLRAWGISAQGFGSGQETISQIKDSQESANPFNIIMIDNKLSDMSGRYLASMIKKESSIADLQLILCSPLTERDANLKYEELGFVAQINKPMHQSKLLNTLTEIWSKKTGVVLKERPQKTKEDNVKNIIDGKNETVEILLAEDNESNQKVASFFLEKINCKVHISNNGLEAVEQVKQKKFDLIFMDCQMPEMDGFEATAEIRKLEDEGIIEKTPIIALTAHAMIGDKELCMKAGMDDYMTKPVSKEKFAELINKWHKPVT